MWRVWQWKFRVIWETRFFQLTAILRQLPSPSRNPKSMIRPRFAALILLVASNPSQADVAANFTDGNTFLTPDQYPGGPGSGWLAGWVTTANPAAPVASVIDTDPVNSGGNYLGVSSSNANDNAIGRRFSSGVGTSVDLTLPTTITFDLRVDELTGWDDVNDYITVHGNNANAGSNFNVSSSSAFIIRAYALSPSAGKNAGEWLFYSGAGDAGAFNAANFQNSGMTVTAGTTYTFTITNDPATKTYTASIFDGTTTVTTAGSLGWRSGLAPNSIAFNQKVNVGTDVIAYSVDSITVQANVEAQPDTVANFADGNTSVLVDQYKGKAGLGWDGAWDVTTGGGTAPTATVLDSSPVNSSGNYLSVSTSYTGDTAIGREFDSTGTAGGYDIATTRIKTTLDLRVDSLAGWDTANDYLTVHSTSNTNAVTRYNLSNLSTFIIRAFGASPAAGRNGGEWLLYNGLANGGGYSANNFVNSGMPVVEGKTYTFTIISDPVTLKYSGSIFDGTNTVTWNNLGWRAAVPADKIGFNNKVSDLADVLGYSLDNVLITQAPASDYDDWASSFNLVGGPGDDDDNDGVTNGEEYAFGLIPIDGSSVNPITVQLDQTAGTFTFQTRDQELTELNYSVWTSTDLVVWTQDENASISPGTVDGNSVQQVAVILTGAPLAAPKLFVQVRAE
jgi:hypothetical protein